MHRVKFDPKNKKTLKELAILDQILLETATETREDLADAILFQAQKTVPIDEGNLLKSGFTKHEPMKSTIGYASSYAVYVHEGTGTHIGKGKYEIKPKTKRVLRFESGPGKKGRREAAAQGRRINPNFVFRKRVMHPGIKGTKWLVKAAIKILPKWDKLYRQKLRRKLQEVRA